MKKIFSILVLLSGTVSAQSLSKGNNLIGSDLTFSVSRTNTSQSKNTTSNLTLAPNFERMLSDRVSVVLNVGGSMITSKLKLQNTLSSQTYKAVFYGKTISGGFNYYFSKNEKANFFIGPEYQYVGANTKENTALQITGKEKSTVNYINLYTGCLYAIQPNLYLSAKINVVSLSFGIKESGLQSDAEAFRFGNGGTLSMGIKKLF
jgi:hypothetical protein